MANVLLSKVVRLLLTKTVILPCRPVSWFFLLWDLSESNTDSLKYYHTIPKTDKPIKAAI